jgi:hypothetical protein
MRITKCDICDKTIKDTAKSVWVSIGGFLSTDSFQVCLDCGKPVTKFLISKKLVKNNKDDKKYAKKSK